MSGGAYISAINNIKNEIYTAQRDIAIGANKRLIQLYWKVGKAIISQKRWGNKIVKRVAADLKAEFPNLKGFSPANLHNMVRFANEYEWDVIVQQLLDNLAWGHNIALLEKLIKRDDRIWYARKSIENGWSRSTLIHQIDTGLHQRQETAKAVNNFSEFLPAPQTEAIQKMMKDPYIFDFIENGERLVEREVEKALIENITKVMMELGRGFAFYGSQKLLKVGEQEFFPDLIFYNCEIHCYVVIELKATKFKPEFMGQLSFYCTAINEQIKTNLDGPTIGILLCKDKDNVVAEFSLKSMSGPVGISEYRTLDTIPKELEGIVPSIEEIEDSIRADYQLS